ncbi:hypothetical protein Q3G72_026482 [Acer saccharum]|nr:hypothetical protein Q3G72_026482 [Acer saccharum]
MLSSFHTYHIIIPLCSVLHNSPTCFQSKRFTDDGFDLGIGDGVGGDGAGFDSGRDGAGGEDGGNDGLFMKIQEMDMVWIQI